MAGHSKWANIKHRKARVDAAKGRIWSRCSKAIIIAAKNGGGEPASNLALRYAIDEAKAANMAKATIEKAIKRGTGELEGQSYEEVRYEGYGPDGVAVIIDCLTDNVKRTAPEMRVLFEKNGGNMGKPGAVSFGFEQKGLFLIEESKATEEQLMEVALEAGADDVSLESGSWEITCDPKSFHQVREAINEAKIECASGELTMLPNNTMTCDQDSAEKILRFIDKVEDHDDVQKVYTNADISEEILEKLS